MSDVLSTWVAAGNSSGFGTNTQQLLATQDIQLSAQVGAFTPNAEFLRILVNLVTSNGTA
jgi:hypothetical protein